MNLEVHKAVSYGILRAHSLAERETHRKKVLQYSNCKVVLKM